MYWITLTALLALARSVFGGCPGSELPTTTIPNSVNIFVPPSGSMLPYSQFHDLDGDENQWVAETQMCSSLISVCNGSASQNNWVQLGVLSLETDMGRINFIEVIVDFSQNCTNSTCFGEFGLYRFDDDGTGNGANVLNYKFVTMSLETGTVIHLNATNTTLYLALRDTGTCVTVSRVRAYYSSCQNPDVMPFTEFPAEVPFGNDVSGSCNGGSLQTGNLSATCSADGVYSLPQTPCECNVGYNGSDNLTCTLCAEGSYKSAIGNGGCMPCPSYSEAPGLGRSNCTCDKGHIRMDPDDILSACNMCDMAYFNNGTGECQSCPSGSNSSGGSLSSCTCEAGLVTMDGSTTTTNMDCNQCQANSYRSDGDCIGCPANSNRMLSETETSCSCDVGRLTASRQNTTTGDPCNSCALTHFLSSGSCEMCISNSQRLSDEDTSCTCGRGYVTAEGLNSTTTSACLVIVGFVASSETFQEGSGTHTEEVTIELAAMHDKDIMVQVLLDGQMDSTIMFSSGETSMVYSLMVFGNDVALENDSLRVLSIQDGNSFIVGGSVDAQEYYYRSVNITIKDDDAVSVGFTAPMLTFNETQRSGTVSVKRTGKIGAPLVLMITNTDDSVINVTQSRVTFNTETTMEMVSIGFVIYDNNVGGQGMSSSQLELKLVQPEEFRDFVNFTDPALSQTVTVVIIDDDASLPPLMFSLEVIIGIGVGGVAAVLLVLLIVIVCICICRLQSVNRQGFYTTNEDKSNEPPTMLRYSASLRSISSQTIVPVSETHSSMVKENEFYV